MLMTMYMTRISLRILHSIFPPILIPHTLSRSLCFSQTTTQAMGFRIFALLVTIGLLLGVAGWGEVEQPQRRQVA